MSDFSNHIINGEPQTGGCVVSDPAAEVARRAWADWSEQFVDPESDGESFQAGYMAAAREALNSDDKLRRIERIASSASWQNQAVTPQRFTWFCAEILTVINMDEMDGTLHGEGCHE